MENKDLVNELWDMADELCARELSANQVYEKYACVSWNELCDRIIKHAALLKKPKEIDLEIAWQGEHYGYYNSVCDAIFSLIEIENLPQEEK